MAQTLTLTPIGFLRTRQQVKFHAGHQASAASEARNELELLPDCDYESALRDLQGFDRLWLLWWFHRNEGWRPMVLPPRGPSQRRGLFSTRSPHRPNPLGLTAVTLLGIQGRTLLLGPCDLVADTPIFDIKPYVPAYDSFPHSKAGWIDEIDAEMQKAPEYTVTCSPVTTQQLTWLQEHWSIDLIPRLQDILSRDPSPHRTRRIKKRSDSLHEIGCGAWKAHFALEGKHISLLRLEPGYPDSFLVREGYEEIPDYEAQLAFLRLWPRLAPGA